MLRIISYLITAMWVAVGIYWLASASTAKPSITRQSYYGVLLRVALLVLIVAALRTPQVRAWLRTARATFASHEPTALVGVVICALGLGLALAARIQLGRNWGMPMSQKLQTELVTSGPYAHARHPIYGGLILGMLGSALAVSLFWALPLVLFTPYFVVSALREERLMLRQFPAEYEDYRQRTKMLIPFVI
ncbi:MAG TPA: isoprenylcysteine carboxylmethyltransferase family protein [Steroidobacteraceae bacterium]|nr:isoprenylcysteine carboxylmethyltransferase family protein [Steroidobacteraceae bacterium]